MLIHMPFKYLFVVLLLNAVVFGQDSERTISVTIDDLPTVTTRRDIEAKRDLTKKLLGHLARYKVPAIGFVNENKLYSDDKLDNEQVNLLRMWLDERLELGNHTFSHRSLNVIDLSEYTADVIKGQSVIRDLAAEKRMPLRYFRHPFLQTGMTLETKREFELFLSKHNYTIAPVTHDNGDYIFSRAYDLARDSGNKKLMRQVGEAYVPYMISKLEYWERQSVRLFDREIGQILLMHANTINAEYFGMLAKAIKKRGYCFVDLETSLKDKAFQNPDRFLGRAGISWLHRWAIEKGKGNVLPDEPLVPDFVLKASGFTSE